MATQLNIDQPDRPLQQRPRGVVVDLFCGAGGLSHGFKREGYYVAAGVDIDPECRYAYERNNDAPFICSDVASFNERSLSDLFAANEPRILVGCAPCQPFSTYNQKNDDPKWSLVHKYADLICRVKPDVVSMENVPRLLEFRGGSVFNDFVSTLTAAGYSVNSQVTYAPDYGVPQKRNRLVVLASRHGPISLVAPTHSEKDYVTVEDALGSLNPIEAGDIDYADPLHRASKLSELNLARVRASRPGGTWHDWEPGLVADCHKSSSGAGYRSVYGRMSKDEPAPTITTQFYGFGNGRFGHPTQDRALSLREGAILQSFPSSYAFYRPGDKIRFKKLGQMIGNAVPVLLGQAIAKSIKLHIAEHNL